MQADAQAYIRDSKSAMRGNSAWHYAAGQDDGFAAITTMFEIMERNGAGRDKMLNALLCENYQNTRTIDLLISRVEKHKPSDNPDDIINKRVVYLRKIITQFMG